MIKLNKDKEKKRNSVGKNITRKKFKQYKCKMLIITIITIQHHTIAPHNNKMAQNQ